MFAYAIPRPASIHSHSSPRPLSFFSSVSWIGPAVASPGAYDELPVVGDVGAAGSGAGDVGAEGSGAGDVAGAGSGACANAARSQSDAKPTEPTEPTEMTTRIARTP